MENDPFSLDEEDTESKPTEDSKSFKELRSAYNRLEKQLKTLEPELTDLRAFRADREKVDRETAISGIFQQVGLNPKHAKLYAALNSEGETTAESVAQFAAEYGLLTEEGGQVEAPPAVPAGAAPTVLAETTAPGSKVYSHDEFTEMLNNPATQAKAFQLYQSGRVKLDGLEAIGGEHVNRLTS